MIYFLQGMITKNVKIGFTSSFGQRLLDLRSSDPLICLTTMPGTKETEKHLHHMFAKWRSHSEWFFPVHELMSFISSLPKSAYASVGQFGGKDSSGKTVNKVIGAVSGGEFTENDGLHWNARLIFTCPLCRKRHVSMRTGKGSLPEIFSAECMIGLGKVEVLPYKNNE